MCNISPGQQGALLDDLQTDVLEQITNLWLIKEKASSSLFSYLLLTLFTCKFQFISCCYFDSSALPSLALSPYRHTHTHKNVHTNTHTHTHGVAYNFKWLDCSTFFIWFSCIWVACFGRWSWKRCGNWHFHFFSSIFFFFLGAFCPFLFQESPPNPN